MSISGIGSSYNNYYSNAVQNKKTNAASEAASTASKIANEQDYLKELQEKYPSLNITTGSSAKGGGTGMGNVMLHPNLVKKMAADPALAAKIENDIKYIPQAENWLKSMTAAGGGRLKACGCVIDENGNMSSWSVAEYGATKEQVKKEEEEELRKKLAETKRTQEKAFFEKFMANHTEQRVPIDGAFQTNHAMLFTSSLFSSHAATSTAAVLNKGDE